MRKTKIICTIGPSSNHPHIIAKLIKSGMNIARLNMAHVYNYKKLDQDIKTIREEASKAGKFVGILMDLAGPKIRLDLTSFENQEISVEKGKIYQLGHSKMNDIPINVDLTFNHMQTTNAYVKIDDGKASFKIIKCDKRVLSIKAEDDYILKNNKGVNFPGIELDIPALTPKDIADINKGIEIGVDWFALSFVRAAEDIEPLHEILESKKRNIPIIAKIEKPEAVQNLESIIDAFDGILIARGDLGVELSLAKLPVLQKKIINSCRNAKKPAIVATQMLESMIESSIPTRAEINDVANAVFEESDAVMLSGETAVGNYPIESVSIMNKIINDVEKDKSKSFFYKNELSTGNDARAAIGASVKTISKHLKIDGIVVMTESGSTAKVVANFRPKADIYAMTPHKYICNQMSLLWGVIPILTDSFLTTDDMLINAEKILLNNKWMKVGQTFILTAGVPVGVPGSTNMLKIQKIEE